MNVFDKASLFRMSYAFMRRFAFIQVNVPSPSQYHTLLLTMLERKKFEAPAKTARLSDLQTDHIEQGKLENGHRQSVDTLQALFRTEARNHIMTHRSLGPAIAWDIVGYLRERAITVEKKHYSAPGHLVEAIMLYVVPQFDNLEHGVILAIYRQLTTLFATKGVPDKLTKLQNEIRLMYPYIQEQEWRKVG